MLRALRRPRRVVITGIGCVTPLGIGRENFWNALIAGTSGVRKIEAFDVSNSPVKIAADVPNFDWEAQINPKDRKHVPRTVPLALAAAREALEDSKIFPNDLSLDERRALVCNLEQAAAVSRLLNSNMSIGTLDQPTRRVSTPFQPRLMAVFRVNSRWRLVCEVYRTSFRLVARVLPTRLAYAAEHIAVGRQDLMLAGGVDAPIAPGILAAFNL